MDIFTSLFQISRKENMVGKMEQVIPSSAIILQTPSILLIGLLMGVAILVGATGIVFIAAWERKRRQTIC